MKKEVFMDVNFTGFSNIYGMKLRVKKMNQAQEVIGNVDKTYLSLMLKDDEAGHDLSEFRKIISTTDNPNMEHPIFDDFITIVSAKETDLNDMGIKNKKYIFFVNNNTPLKVNDKNLKFFTYMAKLLGKIQNIPEGSFLVSDSLMRSGVINKTLFLNDNIPFDIRQFVPSVFFPTNVKSQAKDINKNLQECMTEYFA